MDNEQKLIGLQDEYSTALSSGNNDRARELEKQLDEFITQGTITESARSAENDPKIEENTDPADEPANNQPEAADTTSPSGTESPEATTEGEPAPNEEKTETDNWLESLDPKVRENVEKLLEEKQKLEHQYKSREGREAAYQRRYEEQRKLAVQQEELIKKLKTSSTALPQGQSPAAPKQQTPLTIDDDPDLKQIAETDEQLARTMLRREQQLRQELDQLRNMVDERLAPIQQRYEEVQTNVEMEKLLQKVPNAEEVFRSREWDKWVSLKSERVQALALSDKADDALEALRLYAADMQAWYGNTQQPTQPVQPAQVDPRAGKVQQERERKLQAQPVGSAAVRPPQKANPTMEEILADPELLEKHQEMLYKKELERMGKLHLA
jgi:hypothetical protein